MKDPLTFAFVLLAAVLAAAFIAVVIALLIATGAGTR